jgi:hypothetical protein
MTHLSSKIEIYLDREVDFFKEIILQDDGDGVVYISQWNVAETQPTLKQLDALKAQADAKDASNLIISNRKNDYPEIGDQLDALYHAGVFPANMAARIKETKDKYPK